LVLATNGVSLLPAYARRLLPPSVVARSLPEPAPRITLAIGYNKANMSPVLHRVLAQDEMRVAADR